MIFSLLDLTRTDVLALIGLSGYTNLFVFEIIDIIIMSFVIGYLFSDVFKKPMSRKMDVVDYYKTKNDSFENIKYAALVAGLAVVLHELSHKFVAMGFGAQAVLFAPYGFYLFVLLLKLVGFPLLFFVGGFVAHSPLPPLQSSMVALAGPLMNFALWGFCTLAVNNRWILKKEHISFALPFAKINLFLGIFNMIPIPGFDGFGFFHGLFQAFF